MVKRAAVVVLVMSLSAASGLRAQQNPPPPPAGEQQLAKRLAEEPGDLARVLDLAKFYAEGKRFAEAEELLTRGLALLRQQRLAAEQLTIGQPGAAQAPVRIGGNIREPRKLRHVAPVYPQIAQAANVQGVVILECVIGTDGAVKDTKVLRSIPLLDEAAAEAVRQWLFEPTYLNNAPVPVIMTVTVSFSLKS
jgi:TonB family protein